MDSFSKKLILRRESILEQKIRPRHYFNWKYIHILNGPVLKQTGRPNTDFTIHEMEHLIGLLKAKGTLCEDARIPKLFLHSGYNPFVSHLLTTKAAGIKGEALLFVVSPTSFDFVTNEHLYRILLEAKL